MSEPLSPLPVDLGAAMRAAIDALVSAVQDRDRKLAEIQAERDALRGLLVEQDPPTHDPRHWWAWLPDKFAPLGMCWTEFDTEDEAWQAVRQAAIAKAEGRG